MEYLWKKESHKSDAMYIDIFASLVQDPRVEYFTDFRNYKDNKQSIKFRELGNKEFASKNWSESMHLYNQSLRYAEIDSENVALAYSNRSACFFKLKIYDVALIDIEMAKNSPNLPARIIPKLETRKEECQKLSNSTESSQYHGVELSYEANENYPCLANVLQIKHNKTFGRHLIANCDIPVGKTVLVEENFVTSKNYEDKICYTCCRCNENFIACPHCPDVMFCNLTCMNTNLTHKWECGEFSAFNQQNANTHSTIQMRMILLAIEIFKDVTSLMHFIEDTLNEDPNSMSTSQHDWISKYHLFFKLSTSASSIPGVWEKFSQPCRSIYDQLLALPKVKALFNSEQKKRFLAHLIVHDLLIILTNSIGTDVQRISVVNIWSLLNHSCAPNLFDLSKGEQRYCITIRPVKKGEQLFINYISRSSDLPTDERQKRLKATKAFICKCEKCIPTHQPTSPELIRACDEFALQTQNEVDAIIMKRCIIFLNKFGHLPWSTDLEYLTNAFEEALLRKSKSKHFIEPFSSE